MRSDMQEMEGFRAGIIVALVAALLALGCRTSWQKAQVPYGAADPCANRLHDLAGSLLRHLALHGDLPDDLRDINEQPDTGASYPLVCPVSGEPYAYKKGGVKIAGHAGRLVLYDSTPAHAGMRWGIAIKAPDQAGPMTAHVLLFNEKQMLEGSSASR